jgi:hypothetical protein
MASEMAGKEEAQTSEHPMSEPEYVDPSQLRPGPIRNESLSPDLLDQIRAVFDVIGPYIGMTLEQFEIGFMRDLDPESEVALWCSITAACRAEHGPKHNCCRVLGQCRSRQELYDTRA